MSELQIIFVKITNYKLYLYALPQAAAAFGVCKYCQISNWGTALIGLTGLLTLTPTMIPSG